MTKKNWMGMTERELFDQMGQPGSLDTQNALTVLQIRQTVAQREAAQAQSKAARWMQWSVFALAIATIINVALQFI